MSLARRQMELALDVQIQKTLTDTLKQAVANMENQTPLYVYLQALVMTMYVVTNSPDAATTLKRYVEGLAGEETTAAVVTASDQLASAFAEMEKVRREMLTKFDAGEFDG